MSILTNWGRKLKMIAVPLVLGALAACATPFNANVQRFQSALPAPQGQTFTIVADDPALAGGLEFNQYASLVADRLASLGYRPVNTVDGADLLVRFDYGVDKGRERVRRTGFNDPFYSPWYGYSPFGYSRFGYSRFGYGGFGRGYWGRPWSYGFYDPFFDNGLDVYTVYTSGIDMKIDRRATDIQDPVVELRCSARHRLEQSGSRGYVSCFDHRLDRARRAFELALAQPALTRDSFHTWSTLLQRPREQLRYANFVEVMAPIFSRAALEAATLRDENY